jgi:hypothetical protein
MTGESVFDLLSIIVILDTTARYLGPTERAHHQENE